MEYEPSFEDFCRRCWAGLVRSLSWATGDVAAAEDLAQEALTRAYERWDHVRVLERPDAWVHLVASNLWRTRWRSRRRRGADPFVPAAGDVAESVTEGLALREAVRSLPPKLRNALLLRFVVGLTPDEVASVLGCTPEAVRVRTHRAADQIRRALADRHVVEGVGRDG